MLSVKQYTLTVKLYITRAEVSKLESKEEIEKDTLKIIDQIFKIPV
jgi:hypothetical protein